MRADAILCQPSHKPFSRRRVLVNAVSPAAPEHLDGIVQVAAQP